MTTAILSALPEEQSSLVPHLARPQRVMHAGRAFWLGDLQGRSVVLEVVLRHHHVAHVHPVAHTARHPGEDDARRAKPLNQRRGRGGRRHLAYARQRQHYPPTVQVAQPESTARVHQALGVRQVLDERALLFGQGAENGGGHGLSVVEKRKNKGGRSRLRVNRGAWAPRHYFLSRSSRRKILPTGVLGNSVRNSITLRCL